MNEYAVQNKIKAINGAYHMSDGDSAIVYKVSKYTYTTKDFPDYKEKIKIYKILFNGKICYLTNQGHQTFNYYPGNKYSKKIKEKTKLLWVSCNKISSYANLECYNINGSDYYKIDDIAGLMSKTNKSFNLKYDKAKDAIVINSMSPFKGKAGPMKKGNGKKHKVTLPTTSIVWDGEVTGIYCYKIDGKYYVNPNDIAELTDSRFEDYYGGWHISTNRPHKIDAYG